MTANRAADLKHALLYFYEGELTEDEADEVVRWLDVNGESDPDAIWAQLVDVYQYADDLALSLAFELSEIMLAN